MATMANRIDDRERKSRFVVIHPLDDAPECKIDTEALGPMPMTASVRVSLLSLRAYLMLMFVLVVYHALDLAGAFARRVH